MHARHARATGFTLVEVLVVIGVIAALIAILAAALSGVFRTTKFVSATNNLKQIATYMNLYSNDERDYIVPSQFDYYLAANTGGAVKVRSDSRPQVGEQFKGTWTDILWTVFEVGSFPEAGLAPPAGLGNDYRYDSPDKALYELESVKANGIQNPFRSPVLNTKSTPGGNDPRPYGNGADEQSLPGFFAANNFFDSTTNGFFTTGQIKVPERSVYLVDSFAGEVIEDEDKPWNVAGGTSDVDFRYENSCLFLFLDGHVSSLQTPWTNLDSLEEKRQVRIRNLDQR
jgi:type II secretory pathway pseudopilin PulG